MSLPYILSLADTQATLETVGGKGASLARLVNAGLSVPCGFHVTTAAYKQFVIANNLQPAILEILKKADPGQPSTLEAASRAIHDLFHQAKMPREIAEVIATTYRALDDGAAVVAVRSSATAEDLPDLSFAGQQETFLNIRGVEAVQEAVQKCWASLWTARAIGYRLQHHIDQNAVSLAVVVQRLVPAEAAGILFTANPINGQRDQVMITATWGLGEAIVGGMVTPDTLIVEKANGKVLSRETADKQVMTMRVDGGTEEQPVPEAMRRAPVLSDTEAAELTKFGVQIEKLYGMPMDIEWTLAEEKFAIVQARPITALPPEPELPTPTEWKRPDPKAMCFRGSITEQLPDPLTPLFATLGGKIISHGSAKLFNDLLGKGTASEDMFFTINGYAYYQMRLSPRLLWGMVNAIITFWPEFQRSEQRWRDGSHKRYVAVIEQWRHRSAGTLTAAELLEATRQLMTETVNTYNVLQSGILGLAGAAEVLFTSVYDKLIKQRDDPPAATYLLGFDSLPILAEKSLYDLAQQARTCPTLAEYILHTPAAQLTKELTGDQTPSGVNGDDWQTWQSSFLIHIERYGHTIYDLDFAKPLPADNPAPMLETCKMYLKRQGPNPHERQQRLTSHREQATQAIGRRLKKGWRLKLFRKTLGWAQQFSPLREDSLADLGLGYPLLRKLLRELGHRLTQAGLLDQPDDVYWLYEEEAVQAATALDRNQPLSRLAQEIRQRKAVWQAEKRATPPTALPERSRFSRYVEKIGPSNTAQAAGNILKGAGASQGCITGLARVLRGPEDFDQMQPSEILVAAITTPAWTPLFAMASAIVTDVGGPLSHGSIVAREYGIPAVLGTGVATKRIHSGQTITVDGNTGTVTLGTDPTVGPDDSGSAREPMAWKLPKGAYAAMRNNIVELMIDPLSPLFATLGRSAINTSMHRTLDESLGIKGVMPEEIIITVNHYAYYNGSVRFKGIIFMLVNAVGIMKQMLTGAVERWTEKGRPGYYQIVEEWQAKNWRALSSFELVVSVKQLTESAIDAYLALVSGIIPAAWITETVFTTVYDRLIKRRNDPSAPIYLLGYDSLPIRADKSLYSLAAWVQGHPALSDYLERTPTSQLIVLSDNAPGDVPLTIWQEWRERFLEHLRTFGYTLYDLDFAHSVPADDPAPVLDTLKMYLHGQGVNPHVRQQESAKRREQAMQTMRQQLKGWRLNLFNKFLSPAQEYAPLREDGLAEIGLAYPLIRQLLREIGHRFAGHNVIVKADDIFWLTEDEVRLAAKSLDTGQSVESLASKIPHRKAEHQAALRASPPMALPQMKVFGFDLMSLKTKRGRGGTGEVITGVACSAGSVTGTARVLHGPDEFNQMKPGDVLIASITTPAWTPLFAMASAVVTDVGGPLSHGSIVAREYGIPAVLGTGVATKRIHSGDVITVDGDKGKVYLKARGMPADVSVIEWKPPNPKGIYMRASVVDLMPGPLSPLFATMGIPAQMAQMKPLGRRLTGADPVLHDDYYTTINNYAYMNAAFPLKSWGWILISLVPMFVKTFGKLGLVWRDQMHPEYQAFVASKRGLAPERMSVDELWREAQEFVSASAYYVCGLLFATMGTTAGAELMASSAYNKMAKREGDPDATTLLMGWDNIPVRAEKSLYDLAMWARENDELAKYLLETPTEELTAKYAESAKENKIRKLGDLSELGGSKKNWGEFVSRFQSHLDQFGHIIFQLDFAEPLPLDNPAPMLENIKMYLRGKGTNPHERQKASEAKRIQTSETMTRRLKGFKRWAFTKALNYGQSMAAVREDALAEIGLGYPMLRRILHELGSRFVEAGVIQQAGDIYLLEKSEIDALVSGTQLTLADRVAERKAFWNRLRKETPPPMMPMKKKYFGINTDVWLAASESEQTPGTLKGVPTSAGSVTASACVIHGSEDFNQMKPGAVLVAGTTTPAWTPLFAMASAVVTDIGGPLSHGSIVAREYGIPAVMGTGVATKRIHSGDVITVDGNAGLVKISKNGK